MTDDRSYRDQLTSYDRKMRDWVHKDYSMESFTKFVFKIPHDQCLIQIFQTGYDSNGKIIKTGKNNHIF